VERKCGDGAKVRLCLANVPFVKIEEWSLDYKVTVGQQEVCLAQSLIVMFVISLVLLRGHQYNIDREEHSGVRYAQKHPSPADAASIPFT